MLLSHVTTWHGYLPVSYTHLDVYKRQISDNHMMFGEIGGWFYKGLGGIFPDPENPGFKHILLQMCIRDRVSVEPMLFTALTRARLETTVGIKANRIKLPAVCHLLMGIIQMYL